MQVSGPMGGLIPAFRRAIRGGVPVLADLTRRTCAPWVPFMDGTPEPTIADWAAVVREQETWVPNAAHDGGDLDASPACKAQVARLLLWSVAVASAQQGDSSSILRRRGPPPSGWPKSGSIPSARMARNIALVERADCARTHLEDRIVIYMVKRLGAGRNV